MHILNGIEGILYAGGLLFALALIIRPYSTLISTSLLLRSVGDFIYRFSISSLLFTNFRHTPPVQFLQRIGQRWSKHTLKKDVKTQAPVTSKTTTIEQILLLCYSRRALPLETAFVAALLSLVLGFGLKNLGLVLLFWSPTFVLVNTRTAQDSAPGRRLARFLWFLSGGCAAYLTFSTFGVSSSSLSATIAVAIIVNVGLGFLPALLSFIALMGYYFIVKKYQYGLTEFLIELTSRNLQIAKSQLPWILRTYPNFLLIPAIRFVIGQVLRLPSKILDHIAGGVSDDRAWNSLYLASQRTRWRMRRRLRRKIGGGQRRARAQDLDYEECRHTYHSSPALDLCEKYSAK